MQITNVPHVTADSEDGQAGHVQEGPAPVVHDGAREEGDPSRSGSAANLSSTAAVTSSGNNPVSDLTSVFALTASASPVSIQALLQPSSPSYVDVCVTVLWHPEHLTGHTFMAATPQLSSSPGLSC